MKNIIFYLVGILVLSGFSGKCQDPGLDEILSKYYQATGLEKMKDFKTIYCEGKSNTMGTEYPFRYYKKRPQMMRMEVDIQGSRMIQAFDGQKGWSVIPWSGSTEPQDMTADESKNLKDQGDFEGALYHWKEKGYTVELQGKDQVEGSQAYKIKLTKPDGDTEIFYIDEDNFVVLKVVDNTKIQGNELESETDFTNYKPVEGVLMPYTLQNKFKGMNGEVTNEVQLSTIEINKEINDSLFVKPVKK
ncbi:MAG TPA: outer membrane lipoprotein-sorting protein [Bacteroidales bacterium]|nr:outer membrane lipoprotein-sorting protein [Bacteroidales bacterium]